MQPQHSTGDPILDSVLSFQVQLPNPGGVTIGTNTRVVLQLQDQINDKITWTEHWVCRGSEHIGSVDMLACHACHLVVLGKISIVDREQCRGWGTRTLALLRQDLPGYHWSTTLQDPWSKEFWQRTQHRYPGEYLEVGRHGATVCAHLQQQRDRIPDQP